jgi:hypothetical protein
MTAVAEYVGPKRPAVLRRLSIDHTVHIDDPGMMAKWFQGPTGIANQGLRLLNGIDFHKLACSVSKERRTPFFLRAHPV